MSPEEYQDTEENIIYAKELVDHLKRKHVLRLDKINDQKLKKAVRLLNNKNTGFDFKNIVRILAGNNYQFYISENKQELVLGVRDFKDITPTKLLYLIKFPVNKKDKNGRPKYDSDNKRQYAQLTLIAIYVLFQRTLSQNNTGVITSLPIYVKDWDKKLQEKLEQLAVDNEKMKSIKSLYKNMSRSNPQENSITNNKYYFLKQGIASRLLEKNGFVGLENENGLLQDVNIIPTTFLVDEVHEFITGREPSLDNFLNEILENI